MIDVGLESDSAVDDWRRCAGVGGRMQSETVCSSSPLSVSSSVKLGIFRIRREDGFSFVPGRGNPFESIEEGSGSGCA